MWPHLVTNSWLSCCEPDESWASDLSCCSLFLFVYLSCGPHRFLCSQSCLSVYLSSVCVSRLHLCSLYFLCYIANPECLVKFLLFSVFPSSWVNFLYLVYSCVCLLMKSVSFFCSCQALVVKSVKVSCFIYSSFHQLCSGVFSLPWPHLCIEVFNFPLFIITLWSTLPQAVCSLIVLGVSMFPVQLMINHKVGKLLHPPDTHRNPTCV